MNDREKFEAWLAKHPDAKFWNSTDAMFAAFLGGVKAATFTQDPIYEMRRYDRFVGDVGWGDWYSITKEEHEHVLSLRDEDIETRLVFNSAPLEHAKPVEVPA
jgi:hypothetical protein